MPEGSLKVTFVRCHHLLELKPARCINSSSSAFPGMAECWKMLQWMDALTDPLFSQVIPLHLPPAFSSVEIFHRRHMAKIKSSPWKVGKSQTCALNSNNDGKQMKRAGNNPSFLKGGFTQGMFIFNHCCVLFFTRFFESSGRYYMWTSQHP